MQPRRWLTLAAALVMFAAGPAMAQTVASLPVPAEPTPKVDDGVQLHGFVSTSLVYNVNRPPSGVNGFRVFDFSPNSFTLDVAELIAEKTVSSAGHAGFRVALVSGSAIPKVSASAGLFRDLDTGKAQDIDLQQAYASYMVSNHVRLDAGKFVTPLGLEVIEGWDSANDNASRSFLFGFAIPFTHTGLRVTASGSRVSGLVMVVNGWDNSIDNNTGKTVAGQLSFAPSGAVSLVVTGITGPEQPADNRDLRTVYDVVSTWKLNSRTSFSLNADYGRESGAAPDGGTARWQSAAAYSRIGLSKAFTVSLRGEIFNDRQGARTGVVQQLTGVTITPEVRLSPRAVVRADLRFDRSSRHVFDAQSGATTMQPTVQFNFYCVF